jgi:hypothetical protein
MRFYETARDELYAFRPWRREASATERLYQAWLDGRDLDRIYDGAEEVDPRLLIFGGPNGEL